VSTKHTPGPWAVVRTHTNAVQIVHAECDQSVLATLNTTGKNNRDHAMKRALLMAGAPELLAALRYLTEMAQFTANGKHNCPEIHGALAEARAAIAKVQP
jgi:hypothetical protein